MVSVGRVAGHRGREGEITIRGCEHAQGWIGVSRVHVGEPEKGREYEVENSRAYRDRLVLKLKGVDDGNQAAGLRGAAVWVTEEDAPRLPEGVHYVDHLVGMLVVDESGHELGRVEQVIATGGTDLLRVQRHAADSDAGEEEETQELLIPIAREYVRSIDEAERRIEVRVPRELLELNR